MTTTRKRGVRRPRGGGGGGGQLPPSVQERATSGLPVWRWRTFPVYFAFALGAFLFGYFGLIVGHVSEASDGSQTPELIFTVTLALLMGFALARITTRFLVTRRLIRNRANRQ